MTDFIPDFEILKTTITIEPKKIYEKESSPILIHGYQLVLTCPACPEQYDVYVGYDLVAYFRLRHGVFRAHVPDYDGKIVYEANPVGDGVFLSDERVKYLTEAILAVQAHYINDRNLKR